MDQICGVDTEDREYLIKILLNRDAGFNSKDVDVPANYVLGDGIRMYRQWKKRKLNRQNLSDCIFVYDKSLIQVQQPPRMISVSQANPFTQINNSEKNNDELE